MTEHRDETIEELFDRGLEVRRAVLGAEYVDNSLKSANDFMMAFQNITTEWCWGYAWTRSGLDRKTRSLINLAMLTALNRAPEIKLHVRGALNNGVTVDEIKEVRSTRPCIAAFPPASTRSRRPTRCSRRWAPSRRSSAPPKSEQKKTAGSSPAVLSRTIAFSSRTPSSC